MNVFIVEDSEAMRENLRSMLSEFHDIKIVGYAADETGAIEQIIADVIKANPGQAADYKSGKEKLFGFFVGQVMKATGGKANPALVNRVLKRRLAG